MSTDVVERIPTWTRGDRLRKAREKTGLDQTEFANELGVSRGTVSSYELDKVRVKKYIVTLWALRADVPVEWIETGEMPGTDGPDPSQAVTKRELIGIAA
jgi:transcriptional regulator with XRE-family HTH domain